MEKFTADIENALNEKLALYRQMNDLLRLEREYIIAMDVDALWKTAEQKKQMTDQILTLRQSIQNLLGQAFGLDGLGDQPHSIAHLIRTLPMARQAKARMRQIKLAIDTEKQEVGQLGRDNQKYVREYLAVIDDVMSVVVDSGKQPRYGQSGSVSSERASSRLIHAQV